MIAAPWFEEIIPGKNTIAKWSIEVEAGLILYSIIRAIKPKHIVEIGSGMGYSTLYIAQALKDNNKKKYAQKNSLVNSTKEYLNRSSTKGHVWSMDVNKSSLVTASKNIRNASLENYVSFISGNSIKVLPSLLEKIGEVTFFFIDGDHSYEQCQKEFNLCIPYLSLWGYIAIHDAVRRKNPSKGNYYSKVTGKPPSVIDFVKNLTLDNRFESLIFDTYCNGLSVHKLVSNGIRNGCAI